MAACGGKPPPKPPIVEKPVVIAVAPCGPEGPVALPADGRLRCNELPISAAFPPGTKLVRQNNRAMTVYSATLEHGIMLLVAEPRVDTPTATRIQDLVISLVKGIAADATTTPFDPPKLAGASFGAGIRFTTPDGGAGVVHAYFANHWLVAAAVGGRLPETATRPEKPAAKAFLASLAIHDLATGTRSYPLANGGSVQIPASAWSTGVQPKQEGVLSEEILMVPPLGIWVGIREIEVRDRCDYLKGATRGASDDIAKRLESIYAGADQPLAHIERGTHGDVSVYAEADTPALHVVMYLVCAGKSAVQLTVAGDRPNAELRPHLETVAKTILGAK